MLDARGRRTLGFALLWAAIGVLIAVIASILLRLLVEQQDVVVVIFAIAIVAIAAIGVVAAVMTLHGGRRLERSSTAQERSSTQR